MPFTFGATCSALVGMRILLWRGGVQCALIQGMAPQFWGRHSCRVPTSDGDESLLNTRYSGQDNQERRTHNHYSLRRILLL